MKTTAFLLIFLFTALNMNAQRDTIKIPELSAEYEILNRDLFPGVFSKAQSDSLLENLRKNAKTEEERRNIPPKFYFTDGKFRALDEYEEYDTSGMLRKCYSGFYYSTVRGREFINPYIYIYREFYPNDGLKKKKYGSVLFDTGYVGKEYRYDEEGNLVETIDYNEGYEFTTEDIINYCIKNGIDVDKRYDSYKTVTTISRVKDKDNNPFWWIKYPLPFMRKTWVETWEEWELRKPEEEILTIDGKTGQLINKSTQELPQMIR